MFLLRLCLFLCVNLFLLTKCSIPQEILCVSETCKDPISEAVGSVTYASSARNVLSFKPGDKITIISKSKNPNDYWGAIIKGRTGFVPSNLIKEIRILHELKNLVPISLEALAQNASAQPKKPESNLPQNTETSNQVQDGKPSSQPSTPTSNTIPTQPPPDTVSSLPSNKIINSAETFKVIEGTTVYVDSPEQITPSVTINTNTQTAVPIAEEKSEDFVAGDQKRATIPPNVLNLNDNYQGQNFLKQHNLTIEADEEENEGEDDDDEEIEEEEEEYEGEEEAEDDLPSFSENEIPKEDKTAAENENIASKTEEAVPTPKPYSANTEEITGENKIDAEVTVVKNSVTSQVNAKIEKDQKNDNVQDSVMEASVPKTSAEIEVKNSSEKILLSSSKPTIIPEEKIEITTEQTNSGGNLQNTTNEEIKISDANVNSIPENSIGGHQSFTTSVPVTASGGSPAMATAESVPDNSVNGNVNYNSIPQGGYFANSMQYSAGISNTPQKVDVNIPLNSAVIKNLNEYKEVTTETTKTIEDASPNSVLNTDNIDKVSHESNNNIVLEKIELTTPLSPLVSEDYQKPELVSEKVNIAEKVTLPPVTESYQTPEIITEAINEKITVAEEMTTPVPFEKEASEVVTEAVTAKATLSEEKKVFETTTEINEQVTDFITEAPENEESGPGFFSQITGMFSSLFESKKDEEPLLNRDEFEKVFPSEGLGNDVKEKKLDINEVSSDTLQNLEMGTCQNPDNNCPPLEIEAEKPQNSFLNSLIPTSFEGIPTSSNTFMYLVITAITVLLFTLGHNFIEKRGKTGPLIAKINKLEQELLVTSKECFLVKEEMQNAKEKITLYENSANDELIISLQTELEESKKTKSDLESQIEVLQQELDAATEAGLDLNKMLSEVLTQKGGSETLLASVENLQAQLNSQQKVIDEMTKKLGVKNEENELLQNALDTANEKAESLEEQLNDMKHNMNIHMKEKEDLTQELKTQINQLQTRINQLGENKDKEITKIKKNSEELQKKLTETSKALSIKEGEFKTLKESVKQIKSKGNVNLESVFDVSRTKAELADAQKEKETLQAKLQEEESSKKSIEEQLKALTLEVQNLKKNQEEAEQKKDEAEKKLEVLSNYFKEKETQLQKELGLQEALWAQKKGDEKTVYNMMKSLQEEVESYKSQNETLKKEILDQERGLKNQIATLEQKAHENWVAARQAERKLEETKQETAQLRNRLTLIEKNTNNVDGKINHRTSEELNGEPISPVMHDTSSPLLFPPPLPLDPSLPPGFMPPHPMFMPPPIGGFMPPPPPPFLPGDRRPPPLGRMSSPPLNNRFSPSSPADFPFERMSSPPLSPPNRNYRSPNEADRDYRRRSPPYNPLHPRNWDDSNEMPGFIPISSQRDSIREHKGSNVSSGHSSSDSLDKSSRHSGRV